MNFTSEHFCHRIETGAAAAGKPQAAFVAITCDFMAWREYDQLPPSARQTSARMGIFMMRWDGSIGFVGGQADPGESLLEAAKREAREELGARAEWVEAAPWDLVCSHETESVAAHLFSWRVDEDVFKALLREQSQAQHWISEGTAFAAHLRDYGAKASLENFKRHRFAPAAKEELGALLEFLDRAALEGFA